MKRVSILVALVGWMIPAVATAELKEVRQKIFGMD
jgi:hypothetical protein